MSDNGAGAPVQSTVVLAGMFDGQELVQELTLAHDPGVSDSQLIGQALVYLRNVGGLMVNSADGAVDFYPLAGFSKVRFSVRRVVIARSAALLQVVQ